MYNVYNLIKLNFSETAKCNKCTDDIYHYIIRNLEIIGNIMIYIRILFKMRSVLDSQLLRMGMAWLWPNIRLGMKRNLTSSDHRRRKPIGGVRY